MQMLVATNPRQSSMHSGVHGTNGRHLVSSSTIGEHSIVPGVSSRVLSGVSARYNTLYRPTVKGGAVHVLPPAVSDNNSQQCL
jgi:hypothetical protein